jgi:hypothetical protein
LARAKQQLAALLAKVDAAKELAKQMADEFQVAADLRNAAQAEANEAIAAAEAEALRGAAGIGAEAGAKKLPTDFDAEDAFEDCDMGDAADDDGGAKKLLDLEKRYADARAKLQQSIAKRAKTQAVAELGKAGVAAEAGALAAKAAAAAASGGAKKSG